MRVCHMLDSAFNEKKNNKNKRQILLCHALVLFSISFIYEIPVSISVSLENYLKCENYEYKLGLLYSVYSIPNLILPSIAGKFMDFTKGSFYIIFGLITLLSQLLFFRGIIHKEFYTLVLSRLLFGIVSELYSIGYHYSILNLFANNSSSTFTISIPGSVSRCGTILNFWLLPYLANKYDVCVTAYISVLFSVFTMVGCYCLFCASKKTRPRILTCNVHGEEDTGKFTCLCVDQMSAYCDTCIHVHPETIEADRIGMDVPQKDTTGVCMQPHRGVACVEDPCSNSSGHAKSCLQSRKNTVLVIVVVMCFFASCANSSFYNIALQFLTIRYYPSINTLVAARLLSLTNIIGLFFVPAVSYITDRYGRRPYFISFGYGLLLLAHFMFLFRFNPLTVILVIAFSLPFTSCYWICMLFLVEPKFLSSLTGLFCCVINLAHVVSPLFSEHLIKIDASHTILILYYMLLVSASICCSLYVIYADKMHKMGLNAKCSKNAPESNCCMKKEYQEVQRDIEYTEKMEPRSFDKLIVNN